MKQLNIYDAKTQLSHLVDEANKGETFIIAKSGIPLAKLSPLKKKKFEFGLMKGQIKLAKDFDAPLSPEIIALFEQGDKSCE